MSEAIERRQHFTILHRQLPHGWSQYFVAMGSQTMYRMPSYLTDALGDLTNAALLIAKGEKEARFSFEDEPGEYRWILKDVGTIGSDEPALKVTILEFASQWPREPDSAGTPIIEGVCAKRQFLLNVKSILRETLAVNGKEAYRVAAGYDFPSDQMDKLDRLTEHYESNFH